MSGDLTIRDLTSHEDRTACVELQRETWGREFTDAVPASVLQIAHRMGGVAAGAFAADGALVGFVFGITGVENGVIVHWSDMLAVRHDMRNRGVGRHLKEFQRQAVARVGGKVIYWTYDPLVARNAHLNFNVFGVSAVQYVRDMYGNTGSELHRGIGTDRLIVSWPVSDDQMAEAKVQSAHVRARHELTDAPIIGDAEQPAGDASSRIASGNPIRIAIPTDISAIQSKAPSAAANWRESTREAFEASLAGNYAVVGFTRGEDRGYYLLARTPLEVSR